VVVEFCQADGWSKRSKMRERMQLRVEHFIVISGSIKGFLA
jgi:hypothetical protein